MRPSHLRNRKFIHKYPQFGNGQQPGDYFQDWREAPHKIHETTKGIRWDHSIFYWWFEYFLRNDEYKALCIAKRQHTFRKTDFQPELVKIYDDWKDIHAYQNDFRKWFYNIGGLLFCEPELPEEITIIRSSKKPQRSTEFLNMSVPVGLPRKVLKRQFEALLNNHREQHGITDDMYKQSHAKYPVIVKNPKVSALKRDLNVWDMKKSGMKHAEIYPAVFGNWTDAQIIASQNAQESHLTVRDIAMIRAKRYDQYVRHSYKKADAAIRNTALGVFPCFDKR